MATNDSGLGDDENIELGANSTVTFKAAGEALSFNTSKIDLSNGADLSIDSTGGAITIAGIAGHSAEIVTITAGADATTTETVSIGDVGDSSHAEIHNLTITADDGITLTGAIYTAEDGSAATVTFHDKVIVDGTVVIDTDDAGTTHDGAIVFTTSIDGPSNGGTNTLTIDSGVGAITLQPIGANNALTTLNINTGSTSTVALSVPNIGAGAITKTSGTHPGRRSTVRKSEVADCRCHRCLLNKSVQPDDERTRRQIPIL